MNTATRRKSTSIDQIMAITNDQSQDQESLTSLKIGGLTVLGKAILTSLLILFICVGIGLYKKYGNVNVPANKISSTEMIQVDSITQAYVTHDGDGNLTAIHIVGDGATAYNLDFMKTSIKKAAIKFVDEMKVEKK